MVNRSFCFKKIIWIQISILSMLVSLIFCDDFCLTGSFTDVQVWVQEDGSLNNNIASLQGLDLSDQPDSIAELRLLLNRFESEDDFHTWKDYSREKRKMFELPIQVRLSSSAKQTEEIGDVVLNKITFLSLARNSLERIPLFYTDASGITGSSWKSLKYLSLYGNVFFDDVTENSPTFAEYSATLNATMYEEINPRHYFSYSKGRSNWAEDLANLNFASLLELDLRNCLIQVLYDGTFVTMPNLRRLYLSDNFVYQIYTTAFEGLSKLVHLDLSRNEVKNTTSENVLVEGMTIMKDAFIPLISLKSLDLSYTKLTRTCARVFQQLNRPIERLSICYTRFPYITRNMFTNTSIKYLDISGNAAMEFMDENAFHGLSDTLEVLYANNIIVQNLKPFEDLKMLKIMSLSNNDINFIEPKNFEKLEQLQIVDLSMNRIKNLTGDVFGRLQNLELLKLEKNNLNLLTPQMMKDFVNLKFLGMRSNSFVCNCCTREFIETAKNNELNYDANSLYPQWFTNETVANPILNYTDQNEQKFYEDLSEDISFHNGYLYYSNLIITRNTNFSEEFDAFDLRKKLYPPKPDEADLDCIHNFTFKLLDYKTIGYQCTDSREYKFLNFFEVEDCNEDLGFMPKPKPFNKTSMLVIIVVSIAVILMLVILIIWKWWSLRYFFMMLKNIAILSVLGKDTYKEDSDKVFFYDVFVSYCDEDRQWVLDEFLPQIECHPIISASLHERDFQVGLSILENIISSMDRSRALLMVISNRFLLSQWCQFEMHLAQHRLLETRREQLILVLLEEIPRRKRPNTLHYLMMTKTYIVWPKNESERPAFWKRLKKSILYGKVTEKTSIA